jgi:hypothetical protein
MSDETNLIDTNRRHTIEDDTILNDTLLSGEDELVVPVHTGVYESTRLSATTDLSGDTIYSLPETPAPVSAVNTNLTNTTNVGGDSNDNGSNAAAGVSLPSVGDIKQAVSDTASQVKDSAGQAVDAAKQTAGQAIDAAKQQVVTQLNAQKERATGVLDGFKQSVHEIGDTFQRNGQAPIAGYVYSVADQVDKVSGYLRDSDIDTLARDAQDFARQNPAIVIGSAFVLGLALARFFKASATNVTSDALVPVNPYGPSSYNSSVGVGGATSRMYTGSETAAATRQDIDSDDAFASGQKPISATGYVPGGVVGGAPA